MAIELTVVSVLLKRRVAENGAAVVPCDTVVQLYIEVLLGTLWFHLYIVVLLGTLRLVCCCLYVVRAHEAV